MHKVINCVALHGENLKMDKEVREVKRGRCACGECEDFIRSDGATRGYCGCLPPRHSKKDAHYSSDSLGGTSGTGTSESLSPEKWKDEDLGLFPNPKGEYTEFSNSILPKFYLSFRTTCPYKERFCRCFVTERKHQWEVHESLKAINHNSSFVTPDNPQQPRKSPLRNVQQQVTSSFTKVETDSQSDVVDRVVGSSPSSSTNELSPETDFAPEPCAETLPPLKYG